MIDQNNKTKLKNLLQEYSAKEVLAALSNTASDLASDFCDYGLKDKAKDLIHLSAVLDDLISGKPFLL